MTGRRSEELAEQAVEIARDWLTAARSITARQEQATADRLHALVSDPAGVGFAMNYVDRIARHRNHRLAAEQLVALVSHHELPGPSRSIDTSRRSAPRRWR